MEGLARAAHGVDAMDSLSPGAAELDLAEQARRWAERTCQEQGFAVKITDLGTVRKVAAAFRGAGAGDSPGRSETASVRTPRPAVGGGGPYGGDPTPPSAVRSRVAPSPGLPGR